MSTNTLLPQWGERLANAASLRRNEFSPQDNEADQLLDTVEIILIHIMKPEEGCLGFDGVSEDQVESKIYNIVNSPSFAFVIGDQLQFNAIVGHIKAKLDEMGALKESES